MRKVIFLIIWVALLLLVSATIFHTTPLALALKNSATLTNFIQRFIGLTVFTLLFVQLILGAFMFNFTKKFGNWIFKFHLFEGVLVYSLALLHPIVFMIFNHYAGVGWDPYRVFINACLLCQTPLEYYYTLGIVSFWLLTITVLTAEFRKAIPRLKANWRKFHVLNYVVFLLVGAHGFLIGTDSRVQPFYSFAVVAYLIVLYTIIKKLPDLLSTYKKWIDG